MVKTEEQLIADTSQHRYQPKNEDIDYYTIRQKMWSDYNNKSCIQKPRMIPEASINGREIFQTAKQSAPEPGGGPP